MGRITVSEKAAMKAITYSDEARDQLMTNIRIMDNDVNSQFSGLQDPSFKRYLELSGQMQDLLARIGGKMEEISNYCQSVISWIRKYREI